MIRPLKKTDYEAWLPLWNENCQHQIGDDVTAETWRRLCNPKESVFGLGAFSSLSLQGEGSDRREQGEGEELRALLHYVLHPTTGQTAPVCYMQDLYVDETHRRKGYAKRLIWELAETGQRENWNRIYWFAEKSNAAAQNLYKTLGIQIDFSLHMMAL